MNKPTQTINHQVNITNPLGKHELLKPKPCSMPTVNDYQLHDYHLHDYIFSTQNSSKTKVINEFTLKNDSYIFQYALLGYDKSSLTVCLYDSFITVKANDGGFDGTSKEVFDIPLPLNMSRTNIKVSLLNGILNIQAPNVKKKPIELVIF